MNRRAILKAMLALPFVGTALPKWSRQEARCKPSVVAKQVRKECEFHGSVSNEWADARNWRMGRMPADGDDVVFAPKRKDAVVRVPGNLTITNLTMLSGTMDMREASFLC